MSDLALLILAMAVATYGSRLAPFYLLPPAGIPGRLERFLSYVPPAAIGALLVPDLFYGPPGYPYAGVLAASTAALLAVRSRALWVTVGGAILVTFLAVTLSAV
ncbi:MAG: AzlD domain-containing protein [Alkalispirochaetaceae bacterium]